MRFGPSRRRVVLPEGELKRFQLPDVPAEVADVRARRRRVMAPVVLAWLLLTFICFQWSEGRLGVRAWVWPALDTLDVFTSPEPSLSEPSLPVLPEHATRRAAEETSLESADLVAAPSGTAVAPQALPLHQGSFAVAADEVAMEASEGDLPPEENAPVTRSDSDGKNAYAGPGCEGARRAFREESFLEKEDPEVLSLLRTKSLYEHCKPELMSLRLCALVHKGKAIGVTVQTEPPSRRVGICAAIVAKTLHYPRNAKPQLVRTEVYFQ